MFLLLLFKIFESQIIIFFLVSYPVLVYMVSELFGYSVRTIVVGTDGSVFARPKGTHICCRWWQALSLQSFSKLFEV